MPLLTAQKWPKRAAQMTRCLTGHYEKVSKCTIRLQTREAVVAYFAIPGLEAPEIDIVSISPPFFV